MPPLNSPLSKRRFLPPKILKYLIVLTIALSVTSTPTQSNTFFCKRHCTLLNAFYIVAVGSAISGIIASWYALFGEQKNQISINTINNRLDILRAELDIMKSTYAPLQRCTKECLAYYKINREHDKEAATLNIESRLLNGDDHLYYFRYSPDPTVFLMKAEHNDKNIRFEPRSLGVLHFWNCDRFRDFLEAVYSTFLYATSENTPKRKELFYPVFSLSMKYCGGFIHNDSFSSDHMCFSMVVAHLALTSSEGQQSMLRSISRNPFDRINTKDTRIELPVMGSTHADITTISHDIYPHKIWLETFLITPDFRLEKSSTLHERLPTSARSRF